jgi:hypothetical protein
MTININFLNQKSVSEMPETQEEYSIPLDISDIINICQEYSKLGWNIQNQMNSILEHGIEESIKDGILTKEALPHIKDFMKAICNNVYFGDSCDQSLEIIQLIELFQDSMPKNISSYN